MSVRRDGALLAVLALSLLGGESTAHAQATRCREGISRETTERLFAVLNHAPAEAECRFEGIETKQTDLEARWSRGGTVLPPIHVVPRECASDAGSDGGAFVVDVPREIGASCPSVVPLIAEFVKQFSNETPVGRLGSVQDPSFRAARGLFICIAIVAFGLAARAATTLRSADRGWLIVGFATFSAGLALRAALPFSLGNWYSEVMPAAGPPPAMRFGPGYFALQSLLRDAGLWNARALVLSQLLIGAAALPLLLGVLRELRVGMDAAAAALVLFAFAPFHARLSATASEHVLAATLCLGLLLAWLRAARSGDWWWLGLAALLFPAVCATRVDMAAQASAVLLWPLLRDRGERDGSLRGWRLHGRAALLGLVAAASLAAAYAFIVLPSHHPTPDWRGHLFALRYFLPQYWWLATSEPGWISLPSVLLAVPGVAAMAVRRPLLLARVAGTLLVAFVALGRTFLHDELLGARYFLFTIPIFLIASGYGFEAVLGLVPRRVHRVVAAAAIAGLALWSGLGARSAYAARYAFQDEYSFARGALAELPAGCAVYEVPIRADPLPHDVDCCLDLGRSPLVLEYPTLHFLDLPDDAASVFNGTRCLAYYESIACEITGNAQDAAAGEFADRAAAYFQPRCAEPHRRGHLQLLAQRATSPRTTENFFTAKTPRAALYRWTP